MLFLLGLFPAPSQPKIDRHALVSRHNVVLTKFDSERPPQVGNGEFAFGMDTTGMQTFAPFNTMSHWGWHTSAAPAGVADFAGQVWDTHGRPVRYPMPDPARPAVSEWLAANPHRINLGRVRMVLTRKDGQAGTPSDVTATKQTLDLWTGLVTSRFVFEGVPVSVKTACDPSVDQVGFFVESPLIAAGRLKVSIECPGNNPLAFANFVGDWEHTGKLDVVAEHPHGIELLRNLDDDDYLVNVDWRQATGKLVADSTRFEVSPQGSTLSLVVGFSQRRKVQESVAPAVLAASRKAWPRFWSTGGAVDLSGSTDPRWKELERRIVLSQYLMRVNEAGSLPPQESGLVNNGWFGRFHMEMYWWHAAHLALWGRWSELDRSLSIYTKLLPKARALAKSQGYAGARWPKCIGPNLVEWPHEIHALLAWQQPHPIFFAELDYRAHPSKATLAKWRDVVESTADFMATYAFYEASSEHNVLGPPIHLVSENTDPKVSKNPTFELAYWRYGLETAQRWRERLGLARRRDWEKVLWRLAPLPMQDGVYVLHEGVKEMWTKFNFEHPALTGAYGVLPGLGVDRATMRRTLDRVMSDWNFEGIWGWDFPMLAMCAARLGQPERAIDLLLHKSSRFQFDERGLATGGPFPYFPSNGGLLYAVAMMARGWDGAPPRNAPGFPRTGWHVRYEGLSPAP